MRAKRWQGLIAILLLMALPLQAALPPRMVGHWIGSYRGQPIEFQMHADGTGTYQGQPMKWDVRYGQLHIDREGESEMYAMKVDSETLVIAGGPMSTLLVLVRVTEPPVIEEKTGQPLSESTACPDAAALTVDHRCAP